VLCIKNVALSIFKSEYVLNKGRLAKSSSAESQPSAKSFWVFLEDPDTRSASERWAAT
jgi:hypothetical protein